MDRAPNAKERAKAASCRAATRTCRSDSPSLGGRRGRDRRGHPPEPRKHAAVAAAQDHIGNARGP
eukprot:6496003-Prymnesium_polylepis.1